MYGLKNKLYRARGKSDEEEKKINMKYINIKEWTIEKRA